MTPDLMGNASTKVTMDKAFFCGKRVLYKKIKAHCVLLGDEGLTNTKTLKI